MEITEGNENRIAEIIRSMEAVNDMPDLIICSAPIPEIEREIEIRNIVPLRQCDLIIPDIGYDRPWYTRFEKKRGIKHKKK